jgi:hypothetical protein
MGATVIEGVTMSLGAGRNVEQAGCSPAEDVRRLRAREITAGQLLDHCLDGADESTITDWRDYVSAVCNAAERQTRNNTPRTHTAPPDVWARLDEIAERWGTTGSAAIQRLIREAEMPRRMR